MPPHPSRSGPAPRTVRRADRGDGVRHVAHHPGGCHALVDAVDGRTRRGGQGHRGEDLAGAEATALAGRDVQALNDRNFEAKLVDVVGLYLNPPERAVVLCFDENSQCQALERSQPSLPLTPGRANTMTHDYKRHGTTTLFAALDIATGKVLNHCFPRRRNREFLAIS